ncbi:MAG: lamin tail domain-containing protein [Anaerolineae bacterium]
MNWTWVRPIALALALAVPSATGALTWHVRSATGATIVLNEVQYDPAPAGSESGYEWVELLNASASAVSLQGWRIADNRGTDVIPDLALEAGEYAVVAASEGFAELFPGYDGRVVTLGGSIGNGLGNSGDRVLLLAPDDTVVDAMSYGDDAEVLNPPAAGVGGGHSLERVPAGADTDTAADWVDQPSPSPGRGASMERPTEPPTAAPPPTVGPGAAPVLNEYLPAPREIDWDGDGEATADDEWIEIYNSGPTAINLRGWQLDDLEDGGSDPFAIAADAVVAPGGFLLLFKKDTGLSLNNGGDAVRLLRPDGAEVDHAEYNGSDPDVSVSRLGDGTGPWTDTLPPSPGSSNTPGGAPPTVESPSATAPHASPTSGATGAASPGASPSLTPGAGASATTEPPGSGTGTPSPGSGTTSPEPDATPTGEAAPLHLPYLLTEVMFDPLLPGNDAGGEWVEIYNRTSQPAFLSGWLIGDRSDWDALPDALVPPHGYVVVVASSGAQPVVEGAPHVTVQDGAIGNGLANRGDVVRLRGPTGQVVDEVSYGRNIDAFDPAVPIGKPGQSVERIPADIDTDSAADWWVQPAPSPGRAGERHVGPPKVMLNEVLPAPRGIDWDGDGAADHEDEWLELRNLSGFRADLTGWRIVRGDDEWTCRLPDGAAIPPGGYLVLYRRDSGLILGNSGDVLTLQRADGVDTDSVTWATSPGYDLSLARVPDGTGPWLAGAPPSPGARNVAPPEAARGTGAEGRNGADRAPRPTAPARAVPLSAVRGLRAGARVRVEGRVTAPPGVFGAREAYVGDEDGGIRVYLGERNGALPDLLEGDVVVATGVLRDYHGERQLTIEHAADLWRRSDGVPVAPVGVATGVDVESMEGRLVRVTGRVTDWSSAAFTLDDGSGPARITIRTATGARRPWLERGQWWSVVGIAGQHAQKAPWSDGHRITPRYATDMVLGGEASTALSLPRELPSTGRAAVGKRLPAGRGPLRASCAEQARRSD